MKKIFISLCIFVFSSTLFAEDLNANRRLGAGFTYVVLLGDLRNYFKNNFAYSANGLYLWNENQLGKLYFGSSLLYAYLKADDIRESSSLRLFAFNLGLDQEFSSNEWYALYLSLRPEVNYWTLTNRLSKNYAHYDSGRFWGLMFGLTNAFYISKTFSIEFYVFNHIPELNFTNTYFDVGLRIAKNF